MNKFEYVYTSNQVIGTYKETNYTNFDDNNKKAFILNLENSIINKEKSRKLSSLISGIFTLILFVTFTILNIVKVINLGDSFWFLYIFFAALFLLLWVLVFNLVGFIFYKKLKITIHFKNFKSNKCITYASSSYYKWVDMYGNYLGKTNFVNDKNELIPYILLMPNKFKNNLVYNRKVSCNVPYFYIVNKNKKIIFLPYFVLLIDGKNSKVYEAKDISYQFENNKLSIYGNKTIIDSFNVNGEFNNNFFNFKYEQN